MLRTVKIAASVSCLALVLASCSSGDDGAETSETTASAAPSPASGTLTIWADETRTPPLEQECAKFAEANGITCEVVQKDFSDIGPDVIQGSQTGDVPDVFITAHDGLGQLVSDGVVAPFDLGANASNFSDTSVAAVTYDGITYGVPVAVENVALLTNPALSPTCPASLDDLVSQAEKLIEDGKSKLPLAMQIGDTGDPYHWYPLYSADGGYIFGDGGTNADDMGVGKEGSVAAAERLSEMAKADIVKASVTGDIASESYTSGDSAWWITGPWSSTAVTEAVPDTMVCPVPDGLGASTPFVGVQVFYIPTKAKNALIAQTFLNEYVMIDEFMTALYQADPRPPAWNAAAEAASSDPMTKGFIEVGKTGIPIPTIPEMSSVWEALGLAQFKVASGEDPKATMEDAGKAITDAINSGS